MRRWRIATLYGHKDKTAVWCVSPAKIPHQEKWVAWWAGAIAALLSIIIEAGVDECGFDRDELSKTLQTAVCEYINDPETHWLTLRPGEQTDRLN